MVSAWPGCCVVFHRRERCAREMSPLEASVTSDGVLSFDDADLT